MAGPIAITNTLAVGIAHASIIRWTILHHPELAEAWLLPVAAETWDGYLNDINGVVDSLVVNSEMIGFRGHRTPALPRDRVVEILKARGAIV